MFSDIHKRALGSHMIKSALHRCHKGTMLVAMSSWCLWYQGWRCVGMMTGLEPWTREWRMATSSRWP